ncbi:MAG: PAS domain S-box protein, partial [Actinomycetota bacterium]|nr:PAS domain S-box protein [Actinomycetota bacterium]
RELAERLKEIVIEVDGNGEIIYCNKKAIEKTGYKRGEIKGENVTDFVVPEDKKKTISNFSGLLEGKELTRSIYVIKRKDGSTFPAITYPDYILDDRGKIAGIREILVDMSDIKEAKEKLKESEKSYKSLFENSLDGIYRTTPEGRYIDANPALVEILGYDSKEEILKIDIPTQLYVSEEERPGPDKRNKIFETRLKKKDGSVITVEINPRVIYKKGKPVCCEGIVRDITQRKIIEKKLKESNIKLKKTLSDTISILASIVEVRDPYTSGHQKRVAQLAADIAEEMKLDSDRVESIKVAAQVHDIGKINLPESILTRPGKLSEIEYDMIKTHSQLGHDMISRVKFPWPIAEFVLQHHERINGSGYPNGLKGNEIYLEAKILGVADVVEAMFSHRPYRPALGINKALEEINKNKGKLYDPDVVDACNRVVKIRKFKFQDDFKPHL